MWTEISVEVDARDAELVAEVLAQRCPRVAVEYRGPFPLLEPWTAELAPEQKGQRALVRLYLHEDEAQAQARHSLRLALRFVPLSGPVRWRPLRRLREDRWQRVWQRHFRAKRIGRVVVRPSWQTVQARAGEVVVEIDPGAAFGTGQHPTTAMCLQALGRLVEPGMRVLDVGTGTGILAIAAVKLGAAWALALDIDPQAVRVAMDNAHRNGVAGMVEVRHGTLTGEVLAHGPFHLVVANIDGLTVRRLAPMLAEALAPRGKLVVSGFLWEGQGEVEGALAQEGLHTLERMSEGVWAALVMGKDA
jgi:ribosomal protein L11 methyltransferase